MGSSPVISAAPFAVQEILVGFIYVGRNFVFNIFFFYLYKSPVTFNASYKIGFQRKFEAVLDLPQLLF